MDKFTETNPLVSQKYKEQQTLDLGIKGLFKNEEIRDILFSQDYQELDTAERVKFIQHEINKKVSKLGNFYDNYKRETGISPDTDWARTKARHIITQYESLMGGTHPKITPETLLVPPVSPVILEQTITPREEKNISPKIDIVEAVKENENKEEAVPPVTAPMVPEEPVDEKHAKVESEPKPLAPLEVTLEIDPNETSITRKGAIITLARVEKYKDLWAETEEEGDKKFIERTKRLWKEFAVSALITKNEETGKNNIQTDLDGRCALGLFKYAGFDTRNVEYVHSGGSVKGKINLDTGNKEGVVVEDGGLTAFLDHHALESQNNTSATKNAYELLTNLGLLKKQEPLNRLVEFVTHEDNRSFPDEEKYFKRSWGMLLGLGRLMNFDKLLECFKDGVKPTDTLSIGQLKKYGLIYTRKKDNEVIDRSKQVKEKIFSSLEKMKKMRDDGFVVRSEHYGPIAIDIDKKVEAGFLAARADGCGAYIIWAPDQKSFFISTAKPLVHEFAQGRKIRETMWIKPRHDNGPLTVTLKEILNTLTDGKLNTRGKLKEYLDKK